MLQADYADRLIRMANGRSGFSEPVRQVSRMHLQALDRRLDSMLEGDLVDSGALDTYTLAHLQDLKMRTGRALDAIYVVQ